MTIAPGEKPPRSRALAVWNISEKKTGILFSSLYVELELFSLGLLSAPLGLWGLDRKHFVRGLW